jgi:hypothetical protein
MHEPYLVCSVARFGVGSNAGMIWVPVTELTDRSPQRFTGLLGILSHIRFAFASARFLSSALIFSIKVIASGVRILRVEFTCAPSQNCFSAG